MVEQTDAKRRSQNLTSAGEPSVSSAAESRILVCGDFGPDHPGGDLLLGGLLHQLRNHEDLKEFEAVVASADPERTAKIQP